MEGGGSRVKKLPTVHITYIFKKIMIKIAHITDFDIADLSNAAWNAAEKTTIDKYWSGADAPVGRHFRVGLLWSESGLYVLFEAYQTEPLVLNEKPDISRKTHKLWEHDVCEIFIAPDKDEPRRYLEFEVAPTGEWLDLIVDWRKSEPRDWGLRSGMETAASVEEELVTMAIKIPWSAFGQAPKIGEVWLGNIFRQVGFGETRGYLTWQPTMTLDPQFHVPDRFGEFIFVA